MEIALPGDDVRIQRHAAQQQQHADKDGGPCNDHTRILSFVNVTVDAGIKMDSTTTTLGLGERVCSNCLDDYMEQFHSIESVMRT